MHDAAYYINGIISPVETFAASFGGFGTTGGSLFGSTAKTTAGTSVFNTGGQTTFGSTATSGFGSTAGQ